MNEAEKKTLLSTALLVHISSARQQENISDRLPTSKAAKVITLLIVYHILMHYQLSELYVTVNGQSHLIKVLGETHDEGILKLKLQIDDEAPTEITSPYKPGDLLIPVEEHHENNVLQFVEKNAHTYCLIHRGTQFELQVMTPQQKRLNEFMPPPFEIDSAKFIISPMPGQVFSVKVQVGDVVPSGEEICVVEAMKMQNILRTTSGGKVKAVRVKVGDTVAADDILVEFE
jgi:biotin carboxyl carrier protein